MVCCRGSLVGVYSSSRISRTVHVFDPVGKQKIRNAPREPDLSDPSDLEPALIHNNQGPIYPHGWVYRVSAGVGPGRVGRG